MMDVRSREKCLKEIRLLQSLNHSNIIRYVDSYIDNNELIIVLEFAEGGDLKGCAILLSLLGACTCLHISSVFFLFVCVSSRFSTSLIKRVRQADRVFEEAMIWNYADQISAGLQHMHARRIMHRCVVCSVFGSSGAQEGNCDSLWE
jgi:NIMA (never in mitosis gene a)-related kinase